MKHPSRRQAIALLACAALASCQAIRPNATVTRLPAIIAHRGGTADAPENTLEAIRLALAHHADALWLTVQLSSDGVPVLYRPADLSALTDGRGPIAQFTAAQLAALNAGWQFQDAQGNFPYRQRSVGIPTLRDALRIIPSGIPVFLDMKALPAAPQAAAVAGVLTEEHAWSRVTLYSTDSAYQTDFADYPQAQLFEPRDVTRRRLLEVLLDNRCEDAATPSAPAAFEWRRDVTVVETFTLGQGQSKVTTKAWTPTTVACFRRRPSQPLIAIGINDAKDYRAAACLGLDAVLADSPAALTPVRNALSGRDLHCAEPAP
jgi:glycerophosphoryl diester phosphodiesterase